MYFYVVNWKHLIKYTYHSFSFSTDLCCAAQQMMYISITTLILIYSWRLNIENSILNIEYSIFNIHDYISKTTSAFVVSYQARIKSVSEMAPCRKKRKNHQCGLGLCSVEDSEWVSIVVTVYFVQCGTSWSLSSEELWVWLRLL